MLRGAGDARGIYADLASPIPPQQTSLAFCSTADTLLRCVCTEMFLSQGDQLKPF